MCSSPLFFLNPAKLLLLLLMCHRRFFFNDLLLVVICHCRFLFDNLLSFCWWLLALLLTLLLLLGLEGTLLAHLDCLAMGVPKVLCFVTAPAWLVILFEVGHSLNEE